MGERVETVTAAQLVGDRRTNDAQDALGHAIDAFCRELEPLAGPAGTPEEMFAQQLVLREALARVGTGCFDTYARSRVNDLMRELQQG